MIENTPKIFRLTSTESFSRNGHTGFLMKLMYGGIRGTRWGPGDFLFKDFYCTVDKEDNSPPVTLGRGLLRCQEQLPSDICGEIVFLSSCHKNVLTAYSMSHCCVSLLHEMRAHLEWSSLFLCTLSVFPHENVNSVGAALPRILYSGPATLHGTS